MMNIIDVHGHIGGWHDFFIPERSAEWLIEMNERIGIDKVGISHLNAIAHDTHIGNKLALEAVNEFPDRLGAWLVVNPHFPSDARIISEQLDQPGVWGLKLHPDVQEYPVTGPGYAPYLEIAESRGVPVLCHGQTRSVWSDPGLIADVAGRYNSLNILMGHAGLWVDGFERAASLACDHPRLYLEICGSRLTTQWLERLVDIAGAEKILFGSDAVFLDPRIGLGKVLYARLTDDDRYLILGGNAFRLLHHRLERVER